MALNHAVSHGNSDSMDVRDCRTTEYARTFAQRGDVETLRALLDAGCDVDERDFSGFTPLMVAAREGHADCARLLLQRGADLHNLSDDGSKDPLGSTAAHIAAERGHKDVLLALLDAGCGVDVKDKWNHTPLRMALHYAVSGGSPDCARLLLRRGANVRNCQAPEYAHTFAQRGDVETLRALLDAGCGVDARDFSGFTPLMVAAREGHTDCARLLIQRGADFLSLPDDGSKNLLGSTAAHYAAERGHEGVLLALLDAGCGVDVKDKWNHTPLRMALQHAVLWWFPRLRTKAAATRCRCQLPNR